MRPKLQKQSALKFAGRTIPRSGGYSTPQLAAESVSKACFGVFRPVIITPATKYINGVIPQLDWGIQKIA